MTRYALLRKSAFLPSEKQDKKGELFFEFSFVPDESSALCDVLTAAADCGLRLYKVDALPLTYTDSEFLYDVILRCPETPEVFALYMSLAVPQYELLGVYRHMGALRWGITGIFSTRSREKEGLSRCSSRSCRAASRRSLSGALVNSCGTLLSIGS